MDERAIKCPYCKERVGNKQLNGVAERPFAYYGCLITVGITVLFSLIVAIAINLIASFSR